MDPAIENISKQTEVPVSQVPQTPQAPAASIPPSPKKSHKMPMLLMALFVIFVIAAFFAGTYYQGMNAKKEGARIVQISQAPNPSPTSNPGANWKTYTNTLDGYSISYPSDWTIIYSNPLSLGSLGSPGFIEPNYYNELKGKQRGYLLTINPKRELAMHANYDPQTSSWRVGEIPSGGSPLILSKPVETTIGENKVITQESYSKDSPILKTKHYYFVENNKVLEVSIQYDPTDTSLAKLQSVLDQILATFKFLDPESSPSGTN
ncbi:MAG: hypothetical protein HYV40_05880 [Candidatus Levybacteria bacterium]|nr:hypothetical protein [Candidatus Levybacteria bacterium]